MRVPGAAGTSPPGIDLAYPWILALGLTFIATARAATCLLPLRLGLRNLQRTDF